MIELFPLAETATLPLDQLPDPEPAHTLRALADGVLSIGFVMALARIGRRAVMGYFLPEDMTGVDTHRTTTDRDPVAVAVMAVAYAIGVGLTSYAVFLLTSLAWALAWAGAGAIVAAVVALFAAKDASPVDDVRLLAEARRNDAE